MRAIITQEDLWNFLVDRKVALAGHFVLTSGSHAEQYFNKDRIFIFPGLIDLLASLISFRFRKHRIQVVAGPTIGAVTLANRVAFHCSLLSGTITRSVYVDEGPEKTRILKRGFPPQVNGKRVLLVEDVLTTAGSAMKTIKVLSKHGGTVMGVAALCNRRPSQNTVESLGVPKLFSLIERDFPDWPEVRCPLCNKGVPITPEPGKGREYLAHKAQERGQ